MLYQAYQTQSDLMSPLRLLAQHSGAALWLRQTEGSVLRKMAAAAEVFSRMRLTHTRPPYSIDSVTVGEDTFAVTEQKSPGPALWHAAALSQGRRHGAAHRCCWWRRCRATSPRCCARPCAPCCRPRRLHHRLAQRARREPAPRRASGWTTTSTTRDAVHGRHRPRRARGGGVPALRGRAGRHRPDGRGRPPRQPRSLTLMAGPVDCRVNPTKVNETGHQQADRMVREEPDQPRAAAACRLSCAACTRASCSSPPS
jgi:poly(3-hydroxybutyrate) depolymerase